MKKIIIIIISFFIISGVNAQVLNEKSIGLSAGFHSGFGFAYRDMYQKFGWQVNIAPYASADNQMISAGLTFMYKLSDYEKTNMFLTVGNHLFFFNQKNESRIHYYYGIGPSIQFRLSDNLLLDIMAGYGGRYQLSDDNIYATRDEFWYFTYTGGFSLLYTIKKISK